MRAQEGDGWAGGQLGDEHVGKGGAAGGKGCGGQEGEGAGEKGCGGQEIEAARVEVNGIILAANGLRGGGCSCGTFFDFHGGSAI